MSQRPGVEKNKPKRESTPRPTERVAGKPAPVNNSSSVSKSEGEKEQPCKAAAEPNAERIAAVPSIFNYPFTAGTTAVLSGYTGSRYVVLLGVEGPLPWTVGWIAATLASALTIAFGGGTLNAFIMQRPPRIFGWQSPTAIAQATSGAVLSWWLTENCGRGYADLPKWSGYQCKDIFFLGDCLNLTLLVAWSASNSWMATSSYSPFIRALRGLVTTYLCVCGGGILRDCVAIAFGVDASIGNISASVVVSVIISFIKYHAFLHGPSWLQMGVSLPLCFLTFVKLPSWIEQ